MDMIMITMTNQILGNFCFVDTIACPETQTKLTCFTQVEYHRQADIEVDEIRIRWRTLEPNGLLLVMEDEY